MVRFTAFFYNAFPASGYKLNTGAKEATFRLPLSLSMFHNNTKSILQLHSYFHHFTLAHIIRTGNSCITDRLEASFNFSKVMIAPCLQNRGCDHAPVSPGTVYKKVFVGINIIYPLIDIRQWFVVGVFPVLCGILRLFSYINHFILALSETFFKLFC